MRIDFYNIEDLRVPKFSHSVAPHRPGLLAIRDSSQRLLIYQDQGRGGLGVGKLSCSSYPPKTTNMKNSPRSSEFIDLKLQDMISCVTLPNDELIIKSFGSNGICTSHITSGKIRWKAKGRLPGMQKSMIARGIDTDGRGHLFVCDIANQCIQIFSLDGDYLGVLLRYGEQDLGIPFRIRWCRVVSSAVILHHRNDGCFISVFSLE